jgi:hypothetical protein
MRHGIHPLFLFAPLSLILTGCHSAAPPPPIPSGFEGRSFAQLQTEYDNMHFRYIIDCGSSFQEAKDPAQCGREKAKLDPLGNYLITVELSGAKTP